MRRMLPRTEAVDATVDLHGRTWRTLGGMFDVLASDVTFDIDIVFSWVDGTSSEFQRARAQRMQAYVVGEGDDSEARFRQIDELKYALRSVYLYAPWIRRIFIATDSPTPAWLADHPAVTVVRSEEFFRDQDALPTHNSHAVESQLHNIDGLSEHFLYSNDDMFFGRPVRPEMFFSPGGITKFIEATTRIGLGEPDSARSGFENAARVNRALLRERFGRVTTRHLEHAATPLRRSVLADLEAEFPEDFARTARSAFRSATDISVTNSLYHYYALMTGRAVVQTEASVRYIETTLATAPAEMERLLKSREYDMFCLNDGSKPEISVRKRTNRCGSSSRATSASWRRGRSADLDGDRHRHRRLGSYRRVDAFRDADARGREPARGLLGVDVVEGGVLADGNYRVEHRVLVHVHEVEGARAIPALGAADGDVEVLRVAGGRGHRDGDACEGARRAVVQVTRDDAAHVGAEENLGEARLVVQLHGHGEVEDARQGRVVHGQDGSVRCGRGEFLGEPVELGIRDLAVVVAGNRRVEGDDAQAVDVVDAVDGAHAGLLGEELLAERCSVVVVSHHPDHLGAEARGDGLDHAAEAVVGVRFTAIGEVARDDYRLGAAPRALQLGEQFAQVRFGIDASVEASTAAQEVGVAQVEEEVVRARVLGRTRVHVGHPSGPNLRAGDVD